MVEYFRKIKNNAVVNKFVLEKPLNFSKVEISSLMSLVGLVVFLVGIIPD